MIKRNGIYLSCYKPYDRKISPFWWTKDMQSILYMLKEISSLFFGFFSLLFVAWLTCISLGEKYYYEFIKFLFSSFSISLLFITFIFSIIHTTSWFVALPKAMGIRINGRDLPEKYLITLCYIGFIIVTVVVLFLALKFFNSK